MSIKLTLDLTNDTLRTTIGWKRAINCGGSLPSNMRPCKKLSQLNTFSRQHPRHGIHIKGTWTGLPFNELNIVVANRIAILWSSWKIGHNQVTLLYHVLADKEKHGYITCFGDGKQWSGLILLVKEQVPIYVFPCKKFVVCQDTSHERYKVVREHHQDY